MAAPPPPREAVIIDSVHVHADRYGPTGTGAVILTPVSQHPAMPWVLDREQAIEVAALIVQALEMLEARNN